MNPKDIVSKSLLKRLLLDMATYLLRLDLVDAELLSTGRNGSKTAAPI